MKDGGPAFPILHFERQGEAQVCAGSSGGMTLRDYFAGQALSGFLGQAAMISHKHDWADMVSPKSQAEKAYAVADAMLAHRSK